MSAIVFRDLSEIRGNFGPCALAIGNFDGVHIGHRALLQATVRLAKELAVKPAVLTFYPHPMQVIAPNRAPGLICTLDQRIRLLEASGVERILVLPFTDQIAKLTPEQFVSQILCKLLKSKAVLVGENFRFGHQQAGTPGTLRRMGVELGFVSQFIEPVLFRGEVVSSSAIRDYLDKGNVTQAGRLLGRCFSVEGLVVSGHGIGSRQTVPTLNLMPNPDQIIPRGVYVSETRDALTDIRWQSITNAGVRPTFGGDELTVETFLTSSLTRPTPENIEVYFRRYIRAETRFPSPEKLKEQILKDVGRANSYWRKASKLSPSIY